LSKVTESLGTTYLLFPPPLPGSPLPPDLSSGKIWEPQGTPSHVSGELALSLSSFIKPARVGLEGHQSKPQKCAGGSKAGLARADAGDVVWGGGNGPGREGRRRPGQP
jgi:hypothetical protein